MRSYRSSVFPLAAMALLAACEDESSTVVALGAAEVSSDLALVAPTAIPERPVVRNVFDIEDAPDGGPARSEDLGYGTYPEPETEQQAESGIFDAKTRANFLPGRLTVIGSHEYVGNRSIIETRASLSFQGSVIGTDNGSTEDAYPFLWPPFDVHYIWAEARIYTNSECGHDGWGDSLHKVWWEAVFGGPAANFSQKHATSRAERVYQPACPPPPPPPTSGTTTTSSGGGGESVCYIWITYDLYTGEIYDQQLLFCTDGG